MTKNSSSKASFMIYSLFLARCKKVKLFVEVRERNGPEDHIEEKEDNEVSNLSCSIDPVSLNPVRIPARVVSEQVNLIVISFSFTIILPVSVSVLLSLHFRVDCYLRLWVSWNESIHCRVDNHDQDDDIE